MKIMCQECGHITDIDDVFDESQLYCDSCEHVLDIDDIVE